MIPSIGPGLKPASFSACCTDLMFTLVVLDLHNTGCHFKTASLTFIFLDTVLYCSGIAVLITDAGSTNSLTFIV